MIVNWLMLCAVLTIIRISIHLTLQPVMMDPIKWGVPMWRDGYLPGMFPEHGISIKKTSLIEKIKSCHVLDYGALMA
ncbi:hypothetical protein D3C72_1471880 [compost metagenome]